MHFSSRANVDIQPANGGLRLLGHCEKGEADREPIGDGCSLPSKRGACRVGRHIICYAGVQTEEKD